ncbi:PTS transporter subunit EIIC [Erysipelothrix urinaevulpis]|uniref:PTS transporter subunit EIIC n=1 Tax=Erysipelothrix urinaevulpis TaxID=2683717 RepID=UPI001F423BC8|nr:PTS transporter subunit EIIC [Erysipelothrix urinaevulpis]
MDKEKSSKKILLCCAAGMSSSIMVKSLREEVNHLGLDFLISSVDVGRVQEYIHLVDYVLIAPQIDFEYQRIKAMAKPYDVTVMLINDNDYGHMHGKQLLFQIQNINRKYKEEEEMGKLSQWLEKYLLPFASKLGSNKVLKIIRDGMSATVALLILGSISILLTNFPHEGIANFLAPSNDFFNTIYAFTSGMMGLITTATIAYYASIEYKTISITSVVTAVVGFLITQSSIVEGWPVLNVDGLGVSGLMTGILVAIISVKILQLFQEHKIAIRMPEGVPEAITESFLSLLPAIVILGGFTLISVVFGFNLNDNIMLLLSPLSKFLNTLPGYVIYHMLCAMVFFLGINSAVVIGVFQAFLTSNSLANEAAYAAGKTVEFVATNSVDTMIWAGGTGATIGLVLLMAFTAKSKMFKTLGRMSLGPGIFNINEPIIFGTPIAFNPIFLLPFVLTPGLIAGVTYILMTNNIISMPIIGNVPWTIPPVFVGYAMSGGDIPTTVWSGLIVVISVVIYYPFFRIMDKQMLEQEQEA